VALLDSPNGKKSVGQIKKGDKVLALTGEVHSVPLRVTARMTIRMPGPRPEI